MSRLTPWTKDVLDESGSKLWASITDGRRGPESMLIDEAGGLIGPFNAMLRSPVIGQRLADPGAELRFNSSLEPRLLELAITTTCAHWKAGLEWFAHSRMARKAGIDRAALDAIASGAAPSFDNEDEALVYALSRQLLEDGTLDGEIYRRSVDTFGETQVVELVESVGFYCLISFIINAFDVAMPAGVEPPWGK